MRRTIHGWAFRASTACLLAVLGAGCDTASGSPPPGTTAAASEAVAARVVFIGKKEACDCTRRAIDAGWKSLEAVLASGPPLSVEKLEVDVDADKIAPYRKLQPFVALPAVYLLDTGGGLVELLQGEIAEADVRAALGRAHPPARETRPSS